MIVVALVGYPFSGKRTLAKALSEARAMTAIGPREIGAVIDARASPIAAQAKELIQSGKPLSDAVFGRLLAQVVAGRNAILIGRPRTLGEVQAFTQGCPIQPRLIHLRASKALVDARRAAVGLPPIETEHPGALLRIDAGLGPVLSVVRSQERLLELDAGLPISTLVEHAGRFLDIRD